MKYWLQEYLGHDIRTCMCLEVPLMKILNYLLRHIAILRVLNLSCNIWQCQIEIFAWSSVGPDHNRRKQYPIRMFFCWKLSLGTKSLKNGKFYIFDPQNCKRWCIMKFWLFCLIDLGITAPLVWSSSKYWLFLQVIMLRGHGKNMLLQSWHNLAN